MIKILTENLKTENIVVKCPYCFERHLIKRKYKENFDYLLCEKHKDKKISHKKY